MLTVRQRYRRTDRQTDRQTDGRTDGRTTYDSNTALALRASRTALALRASRGKNDPLINLRGSVT